MTRSPLTLAAAATAALPRVRVVAAGPLTADGAGRCDAAMLTLEDGRSLVVRAPVDSAAARELAAESLALRALTPGVRALLGVRAPEFLGEAGLGDARALVTDFVPGYQVDAVHLPAGPGAAVSVGRALASVHALPVAVVRAEGLSTRTSAEVRADVAQLLDRAEATGRVPRTLLGRWRGAVASDDLWRFEPTVTLGGAEATSFLFEDTADAGPAVTGVLGWHGLGVGDPATDLRWLASAPDAADDVYAAYGEAAHRAPDALLRSRARLYAELEFAKWLVHGADERRPEIMDDAQALLASLADTVGDDDLVPSLLGEPLDDAMAILDREPPMAPAVDTSMHTDAYDPAELALFVDEEVADRSAAAEAPTDPPAFDDTATAPIDLPAAPVDIAAWADARGTADASSAGDASDAEADPEADAAEAERASREALRRWAASE